MAVQELIANAICNIVVVTLEQTLCMVLQCLGDGGRGPAGQASADAAPPAPRAPDALANAAKGVEALGVLVQ